MFCTAISGIDGRTHVPVVTPLAQLFNCDCVDIVFKPGKLNYNFTY